MDITLPYSPGKRYLTGIDWVVNALHSITQHATGHGNSSQVVMTVEGRIEEGDLRTLIKCVFRQNPVLTGCVRRDWNLCPYWSMGNGSLEEVPLSVGGECGEWSECFRQLEQHVNAPFDDPTDHLHFHLVYEDQAWSHLGMRFDHRLLDAAGAEGMLELIHRTYTGEEKPVEDQISLVEEAHLDRWPQRFKSGRAINQLQVKLSTGEVRACPIPPTGPRPKTRFGHIRMTESETSTMTARAFAESQAPMLLPSLVASVISGLHAVAENRSLVGDHYVVPVSVVDRTPAQKWEKLFFNHISFIIFRVPVAAADDRERVVSILRDQLFEYMANDLPDHFYHASMLTRIMPLELMRYLAKIPMRGKVATSYFACLRESAYEPDSFLGHEVDNMIHMPHVPPPPGLGVFMNGYDDRMNIILSHLEGVLGPTESDELLSTVRRELLD